MNRAIADNLVKAMSRALKSVGYYEPQHPVLLQLQSEAVKALGEAGAAGVVPLLACGGNRIFYAAGQEPLTDGLAAGLAEHLVNRSVVALRLSPALTPKALAALFTSLAESADRLRAAGGLTALLQSRGVGGVEVFEVDFASLFSGHSIPGGIQEPLVEQALKEMLRLHENKERSGESVDIQLSNVGSPASLGGFLDELLSAAAPGLVEAPGGRAVGGAGGGQKGSAAGLSPVRGGRPGASNLLGEANNLDADQVADLAAKAFVGTHQKLQHQNAGSQALQDSARVLAHAMMRLAPDTRLTVLRKLAGLDAPPQSDVRQALDSLSGQVPDDLILSAVLGALGGRGQDPELVRSMGDLLRQLRPVESERRRLLGTLDSALRSQGHAVDGLVWQELLASALGSDGFGMLELNYRAHLPGLVGWAHAHLQDTAAPPLVAQPLGSLAPAWCTARAADLMVVSLRVPGRDVPPTLAATAKDLVDKLEAIPGGESQALRLLAAMMDRAQATPPSPALSEKIKELLTGPKGAQRAAAVGDLEGDRGVATGEAILSALETAKDADAKKQLMKSLCELDAESMKALRNKLPSASPEAVSYLVLAAGRGGASADSVVRLALKNPAPAAKEAALRALAYFPQPDHVALLTVATGAQGDKESQRLLFPTQDNVEQGPLRSLQGVAIQVLGDMRSPRAVPPLERLLLRHSMMGNPHFESQRPAVVRALLANGTLEAGRVLEDARGSKQKNIRETVAKAMPGGRS